MRFPEKRVSRKADLMMIRPMLVRMSGYALFGFGRTLARRKGIFERMTISLSKAAQERAVIGSCTYLIFSLTRTRRNSQEPRDALSVP
jgi:hypothetical protein